MNRNWLTAMTWVAVLAPIPYGISRVLWALGVPVGISEEGMDAIGIPSWSGSPYVLGLAVLSESAGLFAHRFLLRDRRDLGAIRIPRWAVLATGALVSVMVLSLATGMQSPHVQVADPEAFRRSFPDWLPLWAFWTQQAIFWVWGLAIGAATIGYWLRLRDQLAGEGSGEAGQHARLAEPRV
jgi:hypothetical protein